MFLLFMIAAITFDSVLKGLGTIFVFLLFLLLGILLFVIFLLASLLFVPIRYKIHLAYDEEGLKIRSKISYLLRLVTAEVNYEKNLFYRLKISFFSLLSSQKKKKKKEKKRKEKLNREVEKIEKDEKKEEKNKDELEEKIEIIQQRPPSKSVEKEGTKEKKKQKEEKEEGFFEKLSSITKKLVKKWEALLKKWKDFLLFLKELGKKKDAALDFFLSENTIEAIKLFLSEGLCLGKAFMPKKMKGKVRFGTGDVYTEGQYLTYLCLFYGFYAETLEIEPEWEEKVFEADVVFAGKIRLFTILRICIKVYFSKTFQDFKDSIDLVRTRLGI